MVSRMARRWGTALTAVSHGVCGTSSQSAQVSPTRWRMSAETIGSKKVPGTTSS
jgi:hypothetical protein